MSLQISFKHMDSSAALEEYAQRTVESTIRKFISKNFNADVVFEVDNLMHIVKCNVHVDGRLDIHIEQRETNMYAALELLVKKLEQVLARSKDKRRDHHKKEKIQNDALVEVQGNTPEETIDAAEVLAAERLRRRAGISLTIH